MAIISGGAAEGKTLVAKVGRKKKDYDEEVRENDYSDCC